MTYSQLPKPILIELANFAAGVKNNYPENDYAITEKRDGDSIRYTDVFLDNDWYEERVRFFERGGDIVRMDKAALSGRRLHKLWNIFALCQQMGLTYKNVELSHESQTKE